MGTDNNIERKNTTEQPGPPKTNPMQSVKTPELRTISQYVKHEDNKKSKPSSEDE